jgi:hypothetical protein
VVPLWRLLALLVVVGVPAALAPSGERVGCLSRGWGRVLAASAAAFLEELFELVASIGFFVAAAAGRR